MSHEIHHQVSEELTIASERPGFTATGGVFLFKDVDRQPTGDEFLATGVVNRLNPTVDTKSIAAFGQVKVALGSRLSGIIGVRYSRDDKTMDNIGGSRDSGHSAVVVSVPRFDSGHGLDAEVRSGFPDRRWGARVRCRPLAGSRAAVSTSSARQCRPRLRAGVGLDLRGGRSSRQH